MGWQDKKHRSSDLRQKPLPGAQVQFQLLGRGLLNQHLGDAANDETPALDLVGSRYGGEELSLGGVSLSRLFGIGGRGATG